MSLLISIFLNNILPAFLVIGVGVLLDRLLAVDKKTLSRLGIYVLVPALVFSSTVQSDVDVRQFWQLIVFVIVLTVLLVALSLGVGHLLRWSRRTVDALVLSVAFVNAGNLGLSVVLFAFGDSGLGLGATFFVASNVVGNTVAAFFALRSNGKGWRAVLDIFKLPGPYAFALAFALRGVAGALPVSLVRGISLIGQAAVPTMLLMLGVQLSQTRMATRYGQVVVGVGLRLVGGALVAIGLAPLMGLHALSRSVAIVQAAMPTAVTSGLMAVEFEADADYVTSVIFASTLLSGLTLTVLLYWLG